MMDVNQMSVKQLKQLILEHGGSTSDCYEKSDLMDKIKKLDQ